MVSGERVFLSELWSSAADVEVGEGEGLVAVRNWLLLWRVAISEGRWQLQSSRRQLPGLHLQA